MFSDNCLIQKFKILESDFVRPSLNTCTGGWVAGAEQYCAFHENDCSLCDAPHVNMEAKYHQLPFPLLLNVTKHFADRSIGQ